MFFETKIERTITGEDGTQKKARESYIVDCLTFSEAELEMFKIDAESEVLAIKPSRIKEIVNENDDNPCYVCTIVDTFITDDGKEKKLKYKVLGHAKDMEDARKVFEDYRKMGLNDMEITELKLTNLTDITK